MSDNKESNQQRKEQASGRNAYTTPNLKEFGPVGALTQSGTGTNPENAQDMGAMRQMS